MGVDLYIKDEQIRITNYFWYNEFANWAADKAEEIGRDFPHLLNHMPIHGGYVHSERAAPSLYVGSIPKLKQELLLLKELTPPDYAEHCIEQMLKGIALAELTGERMTFDGGAWEDDGGDWGEAEE